MNSICLILFYFFFFFFKQKTAYEIVSRDWSSDVCSSDLDSDVSSDVSSDINLEKTKELDFTLENNLLRVRVDEETGDLTSIFDKVNHKEIL